MREVKFLAYLRKDRKIYSVLHLYWIQDHARVKDPLVLLDDNRVSYPKYKAGDDCDLMEFTGRKDVEGKDIFEDFICSGYGFYDEMDPKLQIGIVKFQGASFVIENINKQCRGGEITLKYKIKIIGNIHQNPELLKKD